MTARVVAEVVKRNPNTTLTNLGMVAPHVVFHTDDDERRVLGVNALTLAAGEVVTCRMVIVSDSWSRGVARLQGLKRDRIQNAYLRMWLDGRPADVTQAPVTSSPSPWVKVGGTATGDGDEGALSHCGRARMRCADPGPP